MAKQALTVKLSAPGVRPVLAAFRRLPKDANAELRAASLRIAELLATSAKTASGIDRQAAAVGTTVKAVRDRVPAVQAGGARRVTSTGARAYELLFGSELGMDRKSGWYARPRYRDSTGRQYASPHRGRGGRWFFPTVERELPAVVRQWEQAADEILRRFEHGG